MIESRKARLHNGLKGGVMITDLYKAFDSVNHELLRTNLKAYGLNSSSVTFMRSYLTNRLHSCEKVTLLVNRGK